MPEQATQDPPAAHADGAERPAHERTGALVWVAVAAITLVAGALRLIDLKHSRLNPFYDAAVRSMAHSWHNFFLGALEPGGSVSIDKPPVDLWLQVASVKALGYSTSTLLLPEALIGTAAVPLLFLAVRRIWSIPAGLAAALALALLPIEVITSRSDTMDGVMMALTVVALLCVAQAVQTGSSAWLIGGAVALGLAFDVKLTESLVALPGLVLFAVMALPGSRRRRAMQLLACAGVYVVVALAWLLATLAVPAHERPFAVGSTNGSAWNAALVFNGVDRLEGKPTPGQSTSTADPPGTPPPSRYAHLSQTEREERIPIRPPSATRLLDRAGPLSGDKLGLLVLAALLLGLPALACELLERRRAGRPPDRSAPSPQRTRLWGLAGLVLWLVLGAGLFSQMAHLHPRYTESIAPAVAGTLGIGLAWACARRTPIRLGALAVCLLGVVIYLERLLFGTPPVWWVVVVCTLGALALAALAAPRARPWVLALALASLLAVPAWASVRAIEHHTSDTNQLGALAPAQLAALSSYLRANQGSARYEAAYDEATRVGGLVVHDQRPLVVLNSINSRVVTPLSRLQALAAAGAVRYAVISAPCGPHSHRSNPDCSAAARWVTAHGANVSTAAGLGKGLTLWLLPGAGAPAGRSRRP
jgi:4-amino-4-deoxy-L-arabinose transferase-like glycosyltransferase